MKRVSKRQAGVKPCKQVRLVDPLSPCWGFATLEVSVGTDRDLYTVEPVQSAIGGRAYHVVKQGLVEPLEDGSGHYHVLVDGAQSNCACKGFLRWGHCRHLWACQKAQERGWLGGKAVARD